MDAGLSFLSGSQRSMFSQGKVLTEKYRSKARMIFSQTRRERPCRGVKNMELPLPEKERKGTVLVI